MGDYLANSGFEAEWDGSHCCLAFVPGCPPVERQVENIFTPPGWVFWFVHHPGTWDQPEGRDAWKNDDARRVRSGDKAYMWFTFNRCHDAGLMQQVDVGVGAELRFTCWAHAWSNGLKEADGGKLDNAEWSDGIGFGEAWLVAGQWPGDTGDKWEDAKPNFIFQVGIDPTGGTDPTADTMVWGAGYHIYNGYCKQLEVEAVAEVDVITVFIRSKTLWAFKHNDAYVDEALLLVDGSSVKEDVRLSLSNDQPEIGNVLWIDAQSELGLTNVAFNCRMPDGQTWSVPFSVWSENGIHHWTAEMIPTQGGEHVVTFSADGVQASISFEADEYAPLPGRGDPREQYRRTYVLLPPDADAAWVQAVVRSAWDTYRVTIGGSADDAGIGDLDERRVVAVNPQNWPDDLLAFFEAHYSGVEYWPVEAATPDELEEVLRDVNLG